MKAKVMVMCLCTMLLVSAIGFATADDSSPISLVTFIEKMYGPATSSYTPLQREIIWKEYSGKTVQGEGLVVEPGQVVNHPLLGRAYQLDVVMRGILNIRLFLTEAALPAAAPLKRGDKVKFVGNILESKVTDKGYYIIANSGTIVK